MGRIITAAAIMLIAAFPGFMFGSFVGLQEFGLGLSVAILLDATVVRAILMPAVMKLLGDWNWYLPARLRRVLRVPAEPVSGTRRPRPGSGGGATGICPLHVRPGTQSPRSHRFEGEDPRPHR